jgi:LacI family transcriptional regulator
MTSTNTIAIAFPIRIGAHYAHVLQAFERYTSAFGWRLVANTIGHLQIENVRPDFLSLLDEPIDAIALIDMPVAFAPALAEMLPGGKPVVSAGLYTLPNVDSVAVRLDQAVREALVHLQQSNPGRIALFGSGIRDEASVLDTFAAGTDLDPRVAVYCDTMRQAGRATEFISGNPGNRRESMVALKNYISDAGCPEALFCFNDEMAIAAARAVFDLDMRVPGDVLIVGCDGIEETEYSVPRLSTVAQPVTQLCGEMWRLLTQRIAEPDAPPASVSLDAKFILRASSSRAAIDQP